MKSKKFIKNVFLVLILLIALFVGTAQQGCEQGQGSQQGLDFSLVTKSSFLSAGSTINQEDTFYVGVKIENYDKVERNGFVCIRDDVEDGFGGIVSEGSGECKYFVVMAAQEKEKSSSGSIIPGLGGSSSEIEPGIVEIYFPSENKEYSYSGMPELVKPYSGKISVSLKYQETTQATGTVTVPDESGVAIAQEPALVGAYVNKALHPRGEGYKLDLEINLVKQGNAKIFLPDFSEENKTYFLINLIPLNLECSVTGKPLTGTLDLQTSQKVKCSTELNSKSTQSFPLVIGLTYGAMIEKSYSFSIKTKS